MAEQPKEKGTSSGSAGIDPMQVFFNQLRGVTEQLAGLGKMADALPIPSALKSIPSVQNLPGLPAMPPMPGALTSAQLGAIAKTVSAQRTSVQAMQGQLGALDEQLGVLESILAPLVQWSTTWASVEKKLVPRSGAAAEDADAG